MRAVADHRRVVSNSTHLRRLLLLLLATTTISALAVLERIGLSGLKAVGWLLPLVVCGFLVAKRWRMVTFPFRIWIPWLLLLAGYLVVQSHPRALQRAVMMACPLVVGLAVSSYRPSEAELGRFERHCFHVFVAIAGGMVLLDFLFFDPTFQETTGSAMASMTVALLACLFAARYAAAKRGSLLPWTLSFLFPVYGVTRMGILATGVTLPTTLVPTSARRRLAILPFVVLAGAAVFMSDRVQAKMFRSGSGEMRDLSVENPDLQDNGRFYMWRIMTDGIAERPWLGHGANAVDDLLLAEHGFLTHPHNDWLRLLYDYGYLGTAVFTLTLLAQTWSVVRRSKRISGAAMRLGLAGVSAFLPFALNMYTDNILFYAAFFGNLQFAFIGAFYGAEAQQQAALAGGAVPVAEPRPGIPPRSPSLPANGRRVA